MAVPVIGLTKRSIDVLLELPSLEGLSAYMIARRLSRKLNLASSTTKFALSRLESFGLIEKEAAVALTSEGMKFIILLKQQQQALFPEEIKKEKIKVYLWR